MTKDEALKMCLEYIETNAQGSKFAILIKEALAQPEPEPTTKAGELRAMKTELWKQPEQEPVAVWELFEDGWDSIADQEWMETLPIGTKLYTTPPQRTWIGLTDEEIKNACDKHTNWFAIALDLEAKLKEKNT